MIAASARVRWPAWLVLYAAISIALQGFFFGLNNNTFHAPIVLRLIDAPQFVNEPYFQSLRWFVSPVYPLLSFVSTEAEAARVFLVMHFLTRLATIALMVSITESLAPAARRHRAVLAAAFGASMVMHGFTPVGEHGLFINNFTHSELAYVPALAALLAMSRGRMALGGVMIGIAFDVNAFVGVWLGVVVVITWALSGELRQRVRPLLVCGLLAFVIALPTLWWIFESVKAAGPAAAFSYRDYLRVYYDRHFFADASSAAEHLEVISYAISAVLSLRYLGERARPWRAFVLAFGLIYVGGVALPYVTDSRLLLNLCPLRSDGMLKVLAVVFGASMLVQVSRDSVHDRVTGWLAAVAAVALLGNSWHVLIAVQLYLCNERHVVPRQLARVAPLIYAVVFAVVGGVEPPGGRLGEWHLIARIGLSAAIVFAALVRMDRRAAGTLALLMLCAVPAVGRVALPVVVLAMPRYLAAGRGRPQGSWAPWESAMLCVSLLLTVNVFGLRRFAAFVETERLATVATDADWAKVEDWAAASTDVRSTFLVPIDQHTFQWRARRVAFFDVKRGAAVMWAPSYYKEWMRRMVAMKAVGHSPEAMLALGCRESLDFVVVPTADEPKTAERLSPVYANAHWSVLSLARCNKMTP